MAKAPKSVTPPPLDPTVQALVYRSREMTNLLAALAQPGNQDPYLRMLDVWEQISLLLAQVKDSELDMRLRLFAGAFANPKEGTNTHTLPDGRQIKGVLKVNRYIDEAALASTLAVMRERGVANTDRLVRFKPELAKSEWNSLSEEMKLVFSPAITSTEGTPSLDVVIPKKKGRGDQAAAIREALDYGKGD